MKKVRYYENCIDCGCSIHSEADKRCNFCKDKKKGKKTNIDPKWLVRGNISANSNACSMFGDSL